MVGMLDALSLKNTKLGLETLDLMGFPSEQRHARPQPRRHAASGSRDDDVVDDHGPRRRTSSSRATATSRARSTRESRSSPSKPQSGGGEGVPRSSPTARRARARRRPRRVGNGGRACARLIGRRPKMDLHERSQRRDARSPRRRRQRSVRRAQEPRPPARDRRPRAAALQRQHRPGRRCASACSPTSADHLTQESGLSRDDRARPDRDRDRRRHPRPRPARAAARRRHRHARSWSTARYDVWIERGGRLYQTTVRFNDESHLRRIINKIVAQVGRRDRRVARRWSTRASPTAAASTRSSRRSRSAGRWSRSGSSRRNRLDVRRHDPARDAHDRDDRVPRALRPGAAQHPHLGRYRLRQDDAAERRSRRRSRTTSGSSRSRTRPSSGSTSATCCGSSRARRTSRARARSRSATSSATRCACGPTGSSSARSAAPRRSTCSRR